MRQSRVRTSSHDGWQWTECDDGRGAEQDGGECEAAACERVSRERRLAACQTLPLLVVRPLCAPLCCISDSVAYRPSHHIYRTSNKAVAEMCIA